MRIEQSLKFVTDDGASGELTRADRMALSYMLAIPHGTGRAPAIVTSIKYLRERYGIGLKAGKDLAEMLLANPRYLD